MSRNQPGPGGLDRFFRRLPARLFSVPRGQTQPQKKRPSKNGEPHEDERQPEKPLHGVGGKQGRQEDQGIEIEKELYGVAELIEPFRFRLDEKKEEQGKEQALNNAACSS